jgi:hypothetical protein
MHTTIDANLAIREAYLLAFAEVNFSGFFCKAKDKRLPAGRKKKKKKKKRRRLVRREERT